MKNKTLIISGLIIFLVFSLCFYVLENIESKSIIQPGGLHYFLKPGTTPRQFARDLKQQAQLKDPTLLLIAFKQHPGKKIKTGEYLFQAGSTVEDVVEQVLDGRVMYHSFTIIDGWNIYQVMQALQNAPLLQHTLSNATPAQIAKILKAPYATPEGLLLPDTYFYTWNTPDVELLNRAYAAMQDFMNEVWLQRSSSVPYTSTYQALIVASMLQKETANVGEMPIIAGVILKRLAMGMPLQIDSTVIYGMLPGFTGPLTHADLLVKSPYNTYTQKGLPPTPIAMPDKAAIVAALNPASTAALYFVAKGDGTHTFSATLAEQDQAIKAYRKIQPYNKGP